MYFSTDSLNYPVYLVLDIFFLIPFFYTPCIVYPISNIWNFYCIFIWKEIYSKSIFLLPIL